MPETMTFDLPGLPPVGILSFLSTKALADLAQYGCYEKFQPGEVAIEEGSQQQRLYIVVQGRLSVLAHVSGQEISLCTIQSGECLGEVSLFEPGPASATVRVLDEAIFWSLDINELTTYLSEHLGGGGALLLGIARCLSQRLRLANQSIVKNNLTEAVDLNIGRVDPIRIESPTNATSSFFNKLQRRLGGDEKKPKIPTEIKL